MMVGDVTVVGLDTSTVVLGDISMDVPHRAVVTIPADRATLSKDLWRALSQRRLFQLHAGGATQAPVRPVVAPALIQDGLYEKIRHLEAENAQLRATLQILESRIGIPAPQQAAPAIPTEKLDEILTLLKSAGPMVVAGPGVPATRAPATPKVVDIEVPAFIPNEIKPKDFDGRITEVQSETSEATNLGSAANALRKLRKGNQ